VSMVLRAAVRTQARGLAGGYGEGVMFWIQYRRRALRWWSART